MENYEMYLIELFIVIRYCGTIQFHLLEHKNQITYCTRQKSKCDMALAHNTCAA